MNKATDYLPYTDAFKDFYLLKLLKIRITQLQNEIILCDKKHLAE